MQVAHYSGSTENPLMILLVYALTPGGSSGNPQGISYSVTQALELLHEEARIASLMGRDNAFLPSLPSQRGGGIWTV